MIFFIKTPALCINIKYNIVQIIRIIFKLERRICYRNTPNPIKNQLNIKKMKKRENGTPRPPPPLFSQNVWTRFANFNL